MDGILCHHRKPCYRTQGLGRVTDGQPCCNPPGMVGGSAEEECVAVRSGTGGYPSRCPHPSETPLSACDEGGGMADSAAVYIKSHVTGCAGMARYPLPAIYPIPPRPTQNMWRLQQHFLNLTFPWLQKGRPNHGASYWYPWRGHGSFQKNFYAHAHARQPPHIHRSCSTKAKGSAIRVKTLPIITDARFHGTEVQPSDTWPLTKRDRRCSRHTCREHWRKILRGEVPSRCIKVQKHIYLEACFHQIQHFPPFVFSLDGLLSVEVEATLKRISRRLATKCQQS